MRHAALVFVLVLVGCSRSPSDGDAREERGDASRGGEVGGSEPGAEPLALRDRAAAREAYREATGRALEEDGCVEWSDAFTRVVLIGSFAHDRGCMFEGFFIDRQWYDGRRADAVAVGLETRGWSGADIDERRRLAREWVESVVHAFGGGFVHEATTAFLFDDTPDFEPVKVTPVDEMGVLVSGWRERPSGMVWEQGYRFVEYHFDRDGLLTTTSSRGFAVDGERIAAHEAGLVPGVPPEPTAPAQRPATPSSPPPPGSRPRATSSPKVPPPATTRPATKPSTRAPH